MVINPTEAFFGGTYPYGGTEIGYAKMFSLRSEGEPYRVFCEGLGEHSDVLEGANIWSVVVFIRGADDDAIEKLASDGYAEGGKTRHATYSAPGNRVPGQSMLSPGGTLTAREVSIIYVPDDPVRADGFIAYRALPNFQASAEFKFQRGEEFGLPIVFDCLRDGNGDILTMGRIQDFSVPS